MPAALRFDISFPKLSVPWPSVWGALQQAFDRGVLYTRLWEQQAPVWAAAASYR